MDLLQLQAKLTPDIIEVMQKRYKILKHISLMQPIGRRSLAQTLGLTERVLRAEVDLLKQQDLIVVETIGMKLSEDGQRILQGLSPYIKKIFGLVQLEKELESILNIPRVIVISGDADEDPLVQKEIGKSAAQIMRQLVKAEDIVALTGGSTVAEVANMINEYPQLLSVLFVPARGGIGEDHELLANTIVSSIAKKTGGKYRLLHTPVQLSEETYNSLINEEGIQELLQIIRSAGIVIHGIGNARAMAKKRKVSDDVLNLLDEKGAIGEAFGYYFAENGEIVYKMNTIGLKLEDLANIPYMITVAGGKSKANAILAVLKNVFKQTLVTDEGAAKEILRKMNNS